jgi:RNA polymerase sigma factor (TIGR02999 family)
MEGVVSEQPKPGPQRSTPRSAIPANRAASDRYLEILYQELRGLVARTLQRDPRNQRSHWPTDVLHDAYLRLAQMDRPLEGADQLRGMMIHLVRKVLVDYARTRSAQKRGGDWRRVTMTDLASHPKDEQSLDLLDLHESLERLAQRRPRQHEVAILRLFGRFTFREIAEIMELSVDTAKEYWSGVRQWLRDDLDSNE